MTEIILEPQDPKGPSVKDYISIIALILGIIFVSIGSFLAWGLSIGFVVLGVLLIVISVLFGLKG